MSPDPSLALLERWRKEGDEQAAGDLYARYVGRLIGLARSQMSGKLTRRVDAEDVVQSACKSFFVRVRDGRLELKPGKDLWQLLAAITMHKLYAQLEHHTAGKRSLRREEEQRTDGSISIVPIEAVAHDPTPGEALALAEEMERALASLAPHHRQMVTLRLEGHTLPEIATLSGRTERMVRVVLTDFGKHLQERLRGFAGG